MRRTLIVATGAAALAAAVGALGLVLGAPAKEPCCFINPEYAGVCRVVPAEDETCAGILSYLNSPASTGKSYCDRTAIRGGWTEVICETPKTAEEKGTPKQEGGRGGSGAAKRLARSAPAH